MAFVQVAVPTSQKVEAPVVCTLATVHLSPTIFAVCTVLVYFFTRKSCHDNTGTRCTFEMVRIFNALCLTDTDPAVTNLSPIRTTSPSE